MSDALDPGQKRIKILVVDDSDDFRALVVAYLKTHPFDVIEAVDGFSALQVLKEQEFDICLMDYKMPMMDGVTTTKLFRLWEEQVGKKHLVIVALSAFTGKQDFDDFFSAGCDEYLAKPIRRHDLVEALCAAALKNTVT